MFQTDEIKFLILIAFGVFELPPLDSLPYVECWGNPITLHIFSAFVWALAEHLKPSLLTQGTSIRETNSIMLQTDQNAPWTGLRLESPAVLDLAQRLVLGDLGTKQNALALLLPPLGYHGLLPSDQILDRMFRDDQERMLSQVSIANLHLPELFRSSMVEKSPPRFMWKAAMYMAVALYPQDWPSFRHAELVVLMNAIARHVNAASGQTEFPLHEATSVHPTRVVFKKAGTDTQPDGILPPILERLIDRGFDVFTNGKNLLGFSQEDWKEMTTQASS